MSKLLEYSIGHASALQITTHLLACDAVFVSRLGARVDIRDYAYKIIGKAQRFEAWASVELIGLVAVYCNAVDKDVAFITTVSVLPTWQGNGIASHLLKNCIAHVYKLGFVHIEMEVDNDNGAATALYEKHGFNTIGDKDGMRRMILNLEKGPR
jgi:ribosomal protein S18 acetylase RimI-like enzyme